MDFRLDELTTAQQYEHVAQIHEQAVQQLAPGAKLTAFLVLGDGKLLVAIAEPASAPEGEADLQRGVFIQKLRKLADALEANPEWEWEEGEPLC
jgi:hypothetical protein